MITASSDNISHGIQDSKPWFHHLEDKGRVSFFIVSLWVPVEQGLPQGYKGLIVISLNFTFNFTSVNKGKNNTRMLSKLSPTRSSIGKSRNVGFPAQPFHKMS